MCASLSLSLSLSLCVCVCVCGSGKQDAGFQKSATFARVKFNVSSGRDWLKGSFAPGPHNEVSITATTKEMFF